MTETLGQIPFLMIQLGRRLYAKGLVGNPRFKIHKPDENPAPSNVN